MATAIEANLIVTTELRALAEDKGVPLESLPRLAGRRLYLRMIPELVARTSVALRDHSARLQREIIEELEGFGLLWGAPLNGLSFGLGVLLDEYADLIHFYRGWTREPLLETSAGSFVQPWRRSDVVVAADFVALRPQSPWHFG